MIEGQQVPGDAEQVGRTTKAVDHALQRIAVKLKPAVGAVVRAFALA